MNNTLKEAIALLQRLVRCERISRHEVDASGIITEYLADKDVTPLTCGPNNIAVASSHDPGKPTLMLNSHVDTVKPSPAYTFNPYSGELRDGRILGIGSNDAGASLVALLFTFLALREKELPFNLVYAATVEEEVGGENGMRRVLPWLSENGIKPDMVIVGEPTGMQPAVAERGLVVLDCLTHGVTGHAARNEGVNAIYRAIDDMAALRRFKFPKVSEVLGPVKVSITQIEAGRQHNVVPDECRWVVDVRTTDAYTNEETVGLLRGALSPHTDALPRSTRVQASVLADTHPLYRAALAMGLSPFVSPTTSDMSLMHGIPSLKIGPGESFRSHTADEFVTVDELAGALDLYPKLIKQLENEFMGQGF